MTDEDSAPDPPEGYQEPHEPVTATSWWELLPGEIGLILGAIGLFGGLTALLRDSSAVFDVFMSALTFEPPIAYIALLTAGGIAIVLHELVHGAAARLAGCEVSFGRHGWGVATRFCGGFLSRRADVLVTLAPAVVLTVVGVPLLVVNPALVAAMVLAGLIANMVGVGHDFADALALRKLPPGTLLYYGDDEQFAYEPATER
jgi:hypothetical protein